MNHKNVNYMMRRNKAEKIEQKRDEKRELEFQL